MKPHSHTNSSSMFYSSNTTRGDSYISLLAIIVYTPIIIFMYTRFSLDYIRATFGIPDTRAT